MLEIWNSWSLPIKIAFVTVFVTITIIITIAIKNVLTKPKDDIQEIPSTSLPLDTSLQNKVVNVDEKSSISGVPVPSETPAPVTTPTPAAPAPVPAPTPASSPTLPVPSPTPITPIPTPSPVPSPMPTPSPSVGTPIASNEWHCVSGWNSPLRVVDGKIQCLGGTACQPLGNSAQCAAVASKLNTEPDFLKGIQSINHLRLCQLNDAQKVPCGYAISNDGKISLPNPPTVPKLTEWQCVTGYNGPVKFVNGEVHCTGSYKCMEQESFDQCQKVAEKLRTDPTFEKTFSDMGNIRKCSRPDLEPTPCAWTETKFRTGQNSDSTSIRFPNLYGKALIHYDPKFTGTSSLKKLYVISKINSTDIRIEKTVTFTEDGKVLQNETTVDVGKLGNEQPYKLEFKHGSGTPAQVEIYGTSVHLQVFGEPTAVANVAA